MRFDILTIFPEIIASYSQESILKRGQAAGAISIQAHDFRQFATDKHHKVDDAPYGGGPGMVLKVEPIYRCLEAIGALSSRAMPRDPSMRSLRSLGRDDKTKIIIMDPAGKKFDQKMARRFSKLEKLVIICGRYEGFDERVYKFVDEKVSVGDYVLSGGELPALIITEAVARLVPGVLGNPDSLSEETHNAGVKEYPQYTRPENFMGLKVPKILLSGDHHKIVAWRAKKSSKNPVDK